MNKIAALLTVIIKIKREELNNITYFNKMFNGITIINKVLFCCQSEKEMQGCSEDDTNIQIATNLDKYLQEYGCSPENDILVLQSPAKLTENSIQAIREYAYNRLEIGAVSPLCCCLKTQEVLPVKFWGISDGYNDSTSDIFPILYLKGSAAFAVKRKLNLADIFNVRSLLKSIFELGYHYIICDDIVIPVFKCFPELKQNDYYQNLILQIKLHNGRKNLLYLLQADFRADSSNNIGGTQLHVKDLVSATKEKYNVFVVARNREFLQVTAYLPNEILTFQFYIGLLAECPEFYNLKQAKVFKFILSAFQVDLLHVHHTYSMSSDIFLIATEMGIPVILTIHDFYCICPTIKMFDKNNKCCIGMNNDIECRNCLNQLMGIDPEVSYMQHWREHNKEILELCDVLITPSENAKSIITKFYPSVSNKLKVIEHGYDEMFMNYSDLIEKPIIAPEFHANIEWIIKKEEYCIAVEGWAYLRNYDNITGRILLEVIDSKGKTLYIPTYRFDREDVAKGDSRYMKSGFLAYIPASGLADGDLQIRAIIMLNNMYYSKQEYKVIQYQADKWNNLNIAFIGGLSPAKGSNEIYNIITQGPSDVNWFIFGGIDDVRLAKLKRRNLTKTNFYQRDELQAYLDIHHIDLVCILSLWPETFCYTLSEAVAYKRPVIVTDIGALGERTRSLGCGWTIPVENITDNVLKIVNKIKDRDSEFQEKKAVVGYTKLRSLEDMNFEYGELYDCLYIKNEKIREYDGKKLYYSWIKQKNINDNFLTNNLTPKEFENYIIKLENYIQAIKSSRSYSLALKISKLWNRIKK